jgi:hypothetical protein
MSLDREFPTNKAGPTVIIAYTTGTPTRIRLVSEADGRVKRKSFRVRVTTAGRIVQGNKDVSLNNSSTADIGNGMQFTTSERARFDVESSSDNHVSFQPDSTAGNIEITPITDVSGDDPPAAV